MEEPGGDTPLFDCVQATWNVMEQSAGPALLEAHEAGLEVIVKEALANGGGGGVSRTRLTRGSKGAPPGVHGYS